LPLPFELEHVAQKPRDFAGEVFEQLAARIVEVKRDLGIKPAIGPRTLSPRDRANIEARIAEHGGGAEGVEACRRVIEVDAAECTAQGPKGKGWPYWNAQTPFRNAANFERRLSLWREDGDHSGYDAAPKGQQWARDAQAVSDFNPFEDTNRRIESWGNDNE